MNYGLRFVTLYKRQGSRPSPRKGSAKKQMAVEEALQIVVNRTEAKGKGEKEKHIYLNAEFQRIAETRKPSSAINAMK